LDVGTPLANQDSDGTVSIGLRHVDGIGAGKRSSYNRLPLGVSLTGLKANNVTSHADRQGAKPNGRQDRRIRGQLQIQRRRAAQ
jgi:hypothetical protein